MTGCEASHAPNRDSLACVPLVPADVHVGACLGKARAQSLLKAGVQHLTLDHGLLYIAWRCLVASRRPGYEQIRPHVAETALALDSSPAVENPLQEGLQEQLRARLLVVEASHPVFRVLAEILLERFEQLPDLQPTVLANVPGWLVRDRLLDIAGQRPRYHLAVNGVGDGQRRAPGYESEIPDTGDVVVSRVGLAAAQQRLDDALRERLAQFVHELVEVRVATQDQALAGVPDPLERDPPCAVSGSLVRRRPRDSCGLAPTAPLRTVIVRPPHGESGQAWRPKPKGRSQRSMAGRAGRLDQGE